MFAPTELQTPPSSPSSSSASLSNSPPRDSIPLDDFPINPNPTLIHPFEASAKPFSLFQSHEKHQQRVFMPTSSAEGDTLPLSGRFRLSADFDREWDVNAHATHPSVRLNSNIDNFGYDEKTVWDDAIADVVDNGHGTIDLSEHNLTKIPPQISELANFVAIPESFERNLASFVSPSGTLFTKTRLFRRSTTAPANLFASHPALGLRSRSIVDPTIGTAREELRLFLSTNRIRSLPAELFLLRRLTVLSLRGNELTTLPPAIAQLTHLRELHLSNNRLKYLPSEMLGMTLQCLSLFPNPFLAEPESKQDEPRKSVPNSDASPTTVVDPNHARVPALTELCLRVLISPPSGAPPSTTAPETRATNLNHHYGPSLVPDPSPHGFGIPTPLCDVLTACVPGSVAPPSFASTLTSPRLGRETATAPNAKETKEEAITGIGFCPGARHHYESSGGMFVKHLEERLSWEPVIAGVKVGGKVPVRWRGCLRGCLDFLGTEEDHVQAKLEDITEGDTGDIVQMVQFGMGGLGDDWDD